jgi:hypothetical protein
MWRTVEPTRRRLIITLCVTALLSYAAAFYALLAYTQDGTIVWAFIALAWPSIIGFLVGFLVARNWT